MAEQNSPRRGILPGEDDPGAFEDAPAPARPARGARRSTRRPWVLGFVGVLVLLLTAGIALAVVLGTKVDNALDNVNRAPSMMPTATRPAAPASKNPPLTFLLLGSDSRNLATDRGRSDATMLIQLSGDRKTLSLVSLPRDSWVEIPGHGNAKINAAYSYGGPSLATETVEKLLGVRVDHVAVTNFELFMGVIDDLGGVDVVNEHAGTQEGHYFPQGTVHLTGKTALLYCRERYDLPNGDLDRAARQRQVLTAIINKMVSKETLTNPAKLTEVIDKVAPYFTVDDSLTNDEMKKIAMSVAKTGDKPAMHSLQMPLERFDRSADGQSIDVVDEAGVAELGTALKTDAMVAYWDKHKNDKPIKNG